MSVRRTAVAVAGMMLVGVALSACGGAAGSPSPGVAGAGPDVNVAPLRLANCTDWNNADAAGRIATLRQLANFAGGPVGSSTLPRGPVLPEKQAYNLLQKYCAQPFARGFKLYKLYERAASFAGS